MTQAGPATPFRYFIIIQESEKVTHIFRQERQKTSRRFSHTFPVRRWRTGNAGRLPCEDSQIFFQGKKVESRGKKLVGKESPQVSLDSGMGNEGEYEENTD